MPHFEKFLDFQVWLFLQYYYMPNYVMGKQDEWKQWATSSLNGFRISNLCKPN